MKRYIRTAELPAGYLKTNRFNSKIADNNVLQAIEIAISQKFDSFEEFCDRQLHFTSDSAWTGTVTQYELQGYYIQLEATRAQFVAFVDETGNVIRKPRNLDPKSIIGEWDVSGNRGHIEFVSSNRLERKKKLPRNRYI